MNINSDLGEGAGADDAILPSIDSASVACGVHAGSASTAIATALRCVELGVEVGAHPGYDDRPNFGRIETGLAPDAIEALVAFQVSGLAAVVPIAFVKPHGALYRRWASTDSSVPYVLMIWPKSTRSPSVSSMAET